jgi:hypothetical protein
MAAAARGNIEIECRFSRTKHDTNDVKLPCSANTLDALRNCKGSLLRGHGDTIRCDPWTPEEISNHFALQPLPMNPQDFLLKQLDRLVRILPEISPMVGAVF